jgi:hypothetical protein
MPPTPDPRALFLLGRRIERLMFVGTLLIVLCFIETYLATANRQLIRDRSADVITTLRDRIVTDDQRLLSIFKTKPEPPTPPATRLSASTKE